MGRPREHDEKTATALLDAAEGVIQRQGPAAVSVRGLAELVGTTTRAVYSLFGSKEGLLVALGARAFELLGTAVSDHPETDDAAADLVDVGAIVFRRFATVHPVLFRIGFQRAMVAPEVAARFDAARFAALAELEARLLRLERADLLGGRRVRAAACHFHALCEGLAEMELRGALGSRAQEQVWRDALGALVAGWPASVRSPAAAASRVAGRKPRRP